MSIHSKKKQFALGVFGGAFDPIHDGHIEMACALRDEMALDAVRLIPTGHPPHRSAPQATGLQRLAMCRLAVAHEPKLGIDAREVSSTRMSYTVDTLSAIRREIGAHAPLVFLIGSDSLLQLHTWRQWETIPALAHLAVVARAGVVLSSAAFLQDLHPAVRPWVEQHRVPVGRPPDCSGGLYVLAVQPRAISSTMVRQRLALDAPLAEIPRAVQRFISTHALYDCTARSIE